jgi:dihydrodipicolinate synthase/N-acetylneuraminate lyase
MGATGYLSSEGNVVPQLVNSVVQHYAAGDYVAAADAYTKVMQVFTLLSSRVAVKALLKGVGLAGGEPRPPRLLLATDDDMRVGIAKLAAIGIPELEARLRSIPT